MNTLTSSIIICTRNRLNDIIPALKSIQQQTDLPTELIVVDSSDIKLTENPLFNATFDQKQFPHTRLIYKHTKSGLTYQRNIGLTLSKKDLIYFFDDDVILDPQYLKQMNLTFAKNPHWAGGMGSITNMRQKRGTAYAIGHFLRTLFFLQRDFSSGKFTLSGMPTHTYGTRQFKTVEVLGGCCMAYRASMLNNNQFDENLFGYAYMEDCDFSRRVSYHAPLFFNPEAKLCHYNSPTSRDTIIENKAMFIRNYSYLFFKNFYPHNRLKIVAYYWTIIGLFLEAIIRGKIKEAQGYYQGLKQFYRQAANNPLKQHKQKNHCN